MAVVLLTRDRDRIKGVVHMVIGAVLLACALVGFIVGRWVVAIIVLVIASVELWVAYLYAKRAGRLLARRTNPYSG